MLRDPTGSMGLFFQSFWDVIAKDLVDVIQEFFRGGILAKGVNATVISLIPKNDNPVGWSDYRPISLCTFFNKVISKILNNRLATLLPKIISLEQAGL